MSTGNKVTSVAIWGGAVTAVAGLLQAIWTTKPWWVSDSGPSRGHADFDRVWQEEAPVRTSAKGAPVFDEQELQEQVVEPPQQIRIPEVEIGFLDFAIFTVGIIALAAGIGYRRWKKKDA